MKFRCILALLYLVLSCSVFSYTSLTPLLDTEVTRESDNRRGLFLRQSAQASYNPFSFGLNTRMYYRFVLFDTKPKKTDTTNTATNTNTIKITNSNSTGIIPMVPLRELVTNSMETNIISNVSTNTNVSFYKKFKDFSLINTRLDIGIENHFSQANDMLGAYIYFAPVSFFSIKIGGYSTFWYEALKFGYIGYENGDNNKYSKIDVKDATNRDSARGYLFQAAPSIHFKLSAFIFQNTTTITYEKAGTKPYYLNNRLFRPQKNYGFDIKNDTYLLGNAYPLVLGIYYGLIYIIPSKQLDHRFGIAGTTHYKFLDGKLLFDIGLSSGMQLNLENYQGSVFIETQVIFNYKLF